ncbi:hypothetical protein Thermus72351_20600 [Thermus brockianus]
MKVCSCLSGWFWLALALSFCSLLALDSWGVEAVTAVVEEVTAGAVGVVEVLPPSSPWSR